MDSPMTWAGVASLALTTVAIPAVLALLGFAGWATKTLLPGYLALQKSRLQNALNEGNAAVARRKGGEILAENGGVAPEGQDLTRALAAKGAELASIRAESLKAAGARNLGQQARDLVKGELGQLMAPNPPGVLRNVKGVGRQ